MIDTHILDDVNGPLTTQRRLSKGDFARLVKLSPGRISQLVAKGLPVEYDGQIDIARGKLWIAENVDQHRSKAQPGRQKDLLDFAGGQATLTEAKTRHAAAQAEAAELRTAMLRRDVVRAGDVEREWSSILRKVRSAVLAVPSRIRQGLPHLTPHDVQTIDAELRYALEAAANDE